MKLFESVVVVCDQPQLDIALAIRGMLEAYGLRGHLVRCAQKRNVFEVMSGSIPDADYVVMCPGPFMLEGDDLEVALSVVDDASGQWQRVLVSFRPDDVTRSIRLAGRTIISLGCRTGREPIANAMLEAGCRAFIAPAGYVDADACALFTVGFFYHLMREVRDPASPCTDGEAVRLAAGFDATCRDGTGSFQYLTRAY
jgi:hypothetical protein